ncbi:DUF6387 family protein [Pantoea vagans]|uniref:DUF6387 family protein n=1 Tax=Pantoea vagans TaxID=470934 RepID=UPI0023AF6BA2|nr:DUF6387 family protein [Pantoea vagans]MDE8558848.1 DUF6387 family protein [Pantoea vagans]MDE8578853.1 DUF6387 family protein [Pantoea vagans]
MKNWSKQHTIEIKEWLDIRKYIDFESVTLNHLYHELWARAIWYRNWPSEDEEREKLRCEENIFKGNPFLFTANHLAYLKNSKNLYQPPHIFLTTVPRLAQLSIISMLNGLFAWKGGEDYTLKAKYAESFVSEVGLEEKNRTVLLEVDLMHGSDEDITEAIRTALPQWRRVLGVEAQVSEVVRFGYGTIKKIMNYRIIPMIDILKWAKEHDVRISDDRLSRLLYTDEDDEEETRLSNHIRDSDRPLASKAATINFIRQFNYFLNKNPHLKDMKVSDVMKLND